MPETSPPPHRPLVPRDFVPEGGLRRLGSVVRLFDEIPSTSRYLSQHAQSEPDGALAHAELQTEGHGRLGRRWVAPRGAAVQLSVLLHEPLASPLLRCATTLAAVAVCDAIEAATDCTPTVRWPNDVMINHRKVAGVLAETVSGPTSGGVARRALIMGMGVNCLQQTGHFSDELRDRATSLELCSTAVIDRAAVARALVAALDRWIGLFEGRSELTSDRVRRAWRERSDDFGQRVVLMCDGVETRGIVTDVDVDGAILVQPDQGAPRRFDPDTTTRLWDDHRS